MAHTRILIFGRRGYLATAFAERWMLARHVVYMSSADITDAWAVKQQIASTTSRSSRRVALAQGPLSAPEVLSMLLANQVCTMMALADFLDSLEGDPIRDG